MEKSLLMGIAGLGFRPYFCAIKNHKMAMKRIFVLFIFPFSSTCFAQSDGAGIFTGWEGYRSPEANTTIEQDGGWSRESGFAFVRK
jgi:hypothetical protein